MDGQDKRRAFAARIGRPRHATVVAYVALFAALGGGAYAASKIGSNDIKRGAVRAKHINQSQVKARHIDSNAVTADKLGCKGNSPDDVMVRVGSVCIDKYENSLWSARTGGSPILGEEPLPCAWHGQDCKGEIFARSVAGVPPRTDITWFQAQQALANSGKRLPTSAEWQMAVAGTPSAGATPGPADCNTASSDLSPTGQRAGCISDWGANDMVGNASEWTADWDEKAVGCGLWDDGGGRTCIGSSAETESSHFPAVLVRGGQSTDGAAVGPLTLETLAGPGEHGDYIGFRGAR